MRKIYTQVPKNRYVRQFIPFVVLQQISLSPIYIFLAWVRKFPGIHFNLKVYWVGIRLLISRRSRQRLDLREIYNFLFRSIDSVRYFEFSYTWTELSRNAPCRAYMDISSPRLLPLMLLSSNFAERFVIVNPARNDLAATKKIVYALNLDRKCKFQETKIEDLTLDSMSFDAITSISVLEHIPNEEKALGRIWDLLKPNGILVLSVPCASKGFEEYIDFDEYGLGVEDKQGFFFGQRFYDDSLLRERFYRITGEPTSQYIFGERKMGAFFKNRKEKLTLWTKYPYWIEPYMMSKEWKEFRSISELPGIGVTILKFVKPSNVNSTEIK